ncbi:MAG TPA: substrate-binding domain-containing protein, partial [Trueperaceae bacterium]|nr:substrate-binding domain-containing protein [Trueperaceae bacterium]
MSRAYLEAIRPSRRLAAIVFAFLAITTVFLFSGRSLAQSKYPNGTIGVVLMAEDNPFFVALGNGVTAEAHALGYATNVQNGQYSDQKQLQEVQTLVNSGVKGIIFEPYENVPSETAVKYA